MNQPISRAAFNRRLDPPPPDFDETFVRIGRLECEKHYRARRTTITRWLEECGKERLIAERWAFVVKDRTERAEKRRGISRRDMGRIFAMAFPLERPNLSGGTNER